MTTSNVAPLGCSVLLGSMLVMASFQRGLFFKEDALLLQAVLYSATIAWWMWKGRRSLSTDPDSLLIGWPFWIGVTYLLPLLAGQAVSVEGTLQAVLQWTGVGCFNVLLIQGVTRTAWGRDWLRLALTGAGAAIVLGTFLSLYGVLPFEEIVHHSGDERFTASGWRLAGFYQYANMFGAVLGAWMVYHLGLAAREEEVRRLQWYAFPLVWYAAALLLTESRGAMLFAGLGWVIGWLACEGKDRIRYAVLTGGTALCGVLTYKGVLADLNRNGTGLWGWIGLAAIPLVWIWLVPRVLEGLAQVWTRLLESGTDARRRGWQAASVVAVAFALMLAILPQAIWERFTRGLESLFSRQMLYEDAVRLFGQSPVVGFGGESWRSLYRVYQKLPYVGSEVHSGYLSLLLDVGIIGFVLFVAVVCLVGKRLSRRNPALPALLVLMGHSAIDFDMSYGFFWLLVAAFVADSWKGPGRPEDGKGLEHPRELHQMALAEQAVLPAVSPGKSVWMNRLWSGGAGFLTVGSLALSLILWTAHGHAVRAEDSRDPEVKWREWEEAVRLNPWSAVYRERLVQEAVQIPLDERLDILQEGISYEPYRASLHWELARLYADKEDYERYRSSMQQAIALDRFNRKYREEHLAVLGRFAWSAWEKREQELARQISREAVQFYEEFVQLAKKVESDPAQVNDRDFFVTLQAKARVLEAYVLLGETVPARRLYMTVCRNGDESVVKEMREGLARLEEIPLARVLLSTRCQP